MINRKRRIVTGILSGALGLTAVAQEPAAPAQPVKPAEPLAQVKPVAPVEPAEPVVDPFKAPGNVAAAPAEAEKTESGLASIVLTKGTGTEKPSATDTVQVHYTGWQASDGVMFDSSMKRGEPAKFALNEVIKGWTEGVQLMVVGEKRRFWIPSELAYGDQGRVAGNLTFDVELLEIIKPPSAPKDLTAPADAEVTASGLKSKILKAGEGDTTPGPEDVVTAQFTGWKADGEFLTTTVGNPQPAQFKVDELNIKGWAEGLQLMKKGEKRRLWIPAALGFGKEGEAPEGAPAGDLIFDFELIDFRSVPKPPPAPKDPTAPADVAAAPEGAAKTASGISYTVLKAGEGDKTPGDTDLLKINFSGWDANGSAIASNKTMGGPMGFTFDKSPISGWVEILKLMKKGESRRVWLPETLTEPAGSGRGPLTFDLELIEFKAKPSPPESPTDVAAAPADALKTASGLAYKVLKKGTGERKPVVTDTVKVHYAGWTTDGKLFDNSIERDEMAEFPLNGVIKGWTEGVQLMVEGEKTRFWIPVELAYNNLPDRPAGMLVFDIELFEIVTPVAPKKIEAVTPPIRIDPPKPKAETPDEKPAEKPAE
ncbi:MAG: FKBP-type peptidyl-prolyl cis-trans isomerase [Akkermansiaceae bacterium]|jgi:FKBP-type peptidyl-prolyl cis-trans isomerase